MLRNVSSSWAVSTRSSPCPNHDQPQDPHRTWRAAWLVPVPYSSAICWRYCVRLLLVHAEDENVADRPASGGVGARRARGVRRATRRVASNRIMSAVYADVVPTSTSTSISTSLVLMASLATTSPPRRKPSANQGLKFQTSRVWTTSRSVRQGSYDQSYPRSGLSQRPGREEVGTLHMGSVQRDGDRRRVLGRAYVRSRTPYDNCRARGRAVMLARCRRCLADSPGRACRD